MGKIRDCIKFFLPGSVKPKNDFFTLDSRIDSLATVATHDSVSRPKVPEECSLPTPGIVMSLIVLFLYYECNKLTTPWKTEPTRGKTEDSPLTGIDINDESRNYNQSLSSFPILELPPKVTYY